MKLPPSGLISPSKHSVNEYKRVDLRHAASPPCIISNMASRFTSPDQTPTFPATAGCADAWLLLIPSLLVILGVTLWPIISTFILSFY